MSSGEPKAWSWAHAFCKSDLPSTTKHVLHTLHMFMNSFGESCFPSVDEIVTYSGLSKRAVVLHLQTAREAGWIETRQHGFRGRKWRRQEYVPRWPERDLVASCPPEEASETGRGGAAGAPRQPNKVVHEVPRGGAPAAPGVVHEGNHVIENNPSTNPITNPVERERADERDEGQVRDQSPVAKRTRAQVEKLFWKLVKDWPGSNGMPKKNAQTAFAELSADEQDTALAMRDRWIALLRHQKKTHIPAPSTYLVEKLWQGIPDGFSAGGSAGQCEIAKPFGKLWGAMRFADLMRAPYGQFPRPSPFLQKLLAEGGPQADQEQLERRARYGWPKVSTMHEHAVRRHKGVSGDPALEPLAALFGKVHKGSALWIAWQELHRKRGWPWLGEDRYLPEWIWMPDPPDFADNADSADSPFDAVRAALDRFETEHAILIPNEAAQ